MLLIRDPSVYKDILPFFCEYKVSQNTYLTLRVFYSVTVKDVGMSYLSKLYIQCKIVLERKKKKQKKKQEQKTSKQHQYSTV